MHAACPCGSDPRYASAQASASGMTLETSPSARRVRVLSCRPERSDEPGPKFHSHRVLARCAWRPGYAQAARSGMTPYPRTLPRYVTIRASLACDGAWMRIRLSRGSGRRLEGESGWLEIQEARATVAAEAPAMEPVCGNRPEGSRCERRCPGNRTRREAKASQRDKNRRHAGAARQPWRSAKGLREPDGVPREARRGLPGRLGPGPGLPMRHPRTRRTLAGFPAGRTARA